MAARASAALAARPSAGVRIGKQRARAIPVRERERIDVPNTPKRPVRVRNDRLARGNRRRRSAAVSPRGDGAAPGLLANRRAPPTACANDYAARTAG
ncbi:hypothetical protein EGY16_21040 [Burkholderia pseudomallei]|nr:hypothetical protein EGY16_21040 [Burkholderia pseudomallei]